MPQLIVNPTGPAGNSYYVQNENDLLGNGRNGATPETATRMPVANQPGLIVEATLTRPNDTNAYTAGDAIANATSGASPLILPGVGPSGILAWWKMTKNNTNVTNATYRAHVFKASPVNPPNDNAAFSPSFANRANRIGYVDFLTPVVGSDCVDYYGSPVINNQLFRLASGNDLFVILQALGNYGGAALEQFFFQVGVFRD